MTAPFAVAVLLAAADGGSSLGRCWDILPAPFADETGSVPKHSAAVGERGEELWIASDRLARWSDGGWSPVSLPAWGDEVFPPHVAGNGLGAPFVAVDRNEPNGSSSTRIAAWVEGDGGWRFLGERLPSTKLPYLHVNDLTLAVSPTGTPVALWTEELDGRPFRIVVARWEQEPWQRLGSLKLKGDSYYVMPALVALEGEVWAAWAESRPDVLRVVRWRDGGWRELGGRPFATPLKGLEIFKLSLAVEGADSAWLLVTGQRRRTDVTVLFRWDGRAWAPHAVPAGTGQQIVLAPEGAVLASTASDETENVHVNLTQWTGGEWTPLLSGVHAVPGISSVEHVRVFPVQGARFVLTFDEPGPDGRQSRVVRSWPCGPEEEPRSPPPSIRERDTWPQSVEDAVNALQSTLSPRVLGELRSANPRSFHHGVGTGIRNRFGLWRGNDALLDACAGIARHNPAYRGWERHPDTCSAIILNALSGQLRSLDGGS